MNDARKAFYEYIIEHNRKYEYCLLKSDFKLGFNDYQYCPYIAPKLFDNETMCFWQKISENPIRNKKNKGYTFNHIAEMHIMRIANKLDMLNDFYIKHKMHAVE